MSEGINAARRTEDIALDLLKFVASQAHVGTKAAGGTGFGVTATAKPEGQVTELLETLLALPASGGSSGEVVEAAKLERDANPLRVAVVGAGAFGRNHLRVYRELEQAGEQVKLAAVVDPRQSVRAAQTQYGIPGFVSIEDCLAAVELDAASLCVPTLHHASCAQTLLAAGVDLLIEKPLAVSLDEADEIVRLACQHGRTVQVGHLERFNPAVRAVRGLLNRPMFFEVHRLSVFTLRSLDVDVVLEFMIHDLDIVLSLVDSPLRELRAVGLPVLSHRVDIANVRLEFDSGCVANFTASRVSTERVRKMRFFQPHQYLSLDFARQDLLLIDVTAATGLGSWRNWLRWPVLRRLCPILRCWAASLLRECRCARFRSSRVNRCGWRSSRFWMPSAGARSPS